MTSSRPQQPVEQQSRCQLVRLGHVDEPRGSLCVAEVGAHVPFAVQRAYWISGVPALEQRAHHAHREQSELVVAARGSFTVHCDDGAVRSVYKLDSPDIGLLLPPLVFHHLDGFSREAICLVLASGPYDPTEYVSNLEEFRALRAHERFSAVGQSWQDARRDRSRVRGRGGSRAPLGPLPARAGGELLRA